MQMKNLSTSNETMRDWFYANLLCFIAVLAHSNTLRADTFELQRKTAEALDHVIPAVLVNELTFGSKDNTGLGFLECLRSSSGSGFSCNTIVPIITIAVHRQHCHSSVSRGIMLRTSC